MPGLPCGEPGIPPPLQGVVGVVGVWSLPPLEPCRCRPRFRCRSAASPWCRRRWSRRSAALARSVAGRAGARAGAGAGARVGGAGGRRRGRVGRGHGRVGRGRGCGRASGALVSPSAGTRALIARARARARARAGAGARVGGAGGRRRGRVGRGHLGSSRSWSGIRCPDRPGPGRCCSARCRPSRCQSPFRCRCRCQCQCQWRSQSQSQFPGRSRRSERPALDRSPECWWCRPGRSSRGNQHSAPTRSRRSRPRAGR